MTVLLKNQKNDQLVINNKFNTKQSINDKPLNINKILIKITQKLQLLTPFMIYPQKTKQELIHSQSQQLKLNTYIKPYSRLVFPTKQSNQGYSGKKHFDAHNQDKIILSYQQPSKFIKKNSLDISDIEGARPKSRILTVDRRKNMQSSHLNRKPKNKKIDCEDSLDLFIRNKTNNSKTTVLQQQIICNGKHNQTNQIKKLLWKCRLQITKGNILGEEEHKQQLQHSKSKQNTIRPNYINPTFLSSIPFMQ